MSFIVQALAAVLVLATLALVYVMVRLTIALGKED